MTPPIVLVHGIRVSGSMWWPTRDRLVARGHRVLTPDLPGHGARRGEPFTLERAVEAVVAEIDAVGGPVLLGGLSLGGYVALATAVRHPDRVAGVVGFGCTTEPRGIGLRVYRAFGRLAATYPERAERASVRAFRSLPAEAAEAVLAGGFACEAAVDAVEAVATSDLPRSLAGTDVGVWFVNGAKDWFRAEEDRFLAAVPDSRLIIVPGVGHIGLLARPDDLAGILDDAALVLVRSRPQVRAS